MASLMATRAFIDKMNAEGIKFTEIDPDDDENIKSVWTCDGTDLKFLTCISKKDGGKSASNYCFGFYSIDMSDARTYVQALRVANDLNCRWRWVRFQVNRAKNKIDATFDIDLGGGSASAAAIGEILVNNLRHFTNVTTDGLKYFREQLGR